MRRRHPLERLATYLTVASAVIGFADQIHRASQTYRSYKEERRRKRNGFGFGVKR